MHDAKDQDAIINIMRDDLIQEMEIGFDHVDSIIDATRQKGITGAIIHQVEKFVFTYFARESTREKTIKQMDIIFNASREMAAGVPMQEIGKHWFKQYLHNDETYHRCDRHHARFADIVNNTKASFEGRIVETSEMLQRGTGSTGAELLRSTFPRKDEALVFVDGQLQCVKNEIDILTKYPEILKVPIAKKRILVIIIKGFQYAMERIHSNLDEIYDVP
ncbi:MAG TPA: hypothetical protein VKM55_13200 [Candidatus Lokiarchaeia archaeon]|nr:hypothetical protein [Candidatus Lokiarchaeia archaeon]